VKLQFIAIAYQTIGERPLPGAWDRNGRRIWGTVARGPSLL